MGTCRFLINTHLQVDISLCYRECAMLRQSLSEHSTDHKKGHPSGDFVTQGDHKELVNRISAMENQLKVRLFLMCCMHLVDRQICIQVCSQLKCLSHLNSCT
jgi:hypothetical protein